MKISMFATALASLILVAGCAQDPRPAVTVSDDSATAADRIASDKMMTADLMRRAQLKGTFNDALAIAMQDSAVAREVMETLAADPRYSATTVATTSAPAAKSTAKSVAPAGRTVVVRKSSGTAKTNNSGDVLDKTERTVQTANEKLDQAARIRQQVDEARRKAGQILHP